ncbi:HD-GYP domain-containing protein [Streptomyces sp. NPDC090052]|uniref:HD-GYP domain-containing protein n=1 Tax=unclassified Streptomyces TaxID=2593676 RepID=UPI0022545C5B|nr:MULTISPECIES: HD domain-containing protein [unclassified Streptomyces]MCX4723875.1 metal-dependent phosphohydrolase [Streptomyces sp. NBC_01306]WSV06572.1 metal-dependent phosphohydrolase [Streptomyces sp. NBC_01020]WSX67294.1 metal-dependent phosphohydrolase [Streptomyces sp. NBC_00932]
MSARTPRAVCLVHGAAALVAAAGLGWTLWHGVGDRDTALAFGILVAAGELTRRTGPGSEREPAPLGAAGALAYALLGQNGGHPTVHGAPQVVAVVVAGTLAGTAPHVPRGRGPTADQLARRVLTVAFAAACFQPLCGSGRTAAWAVRGPSYAVVLLLLLGLTALCDAVLAAAMAHARTRSPAPGARSRPTGGVPIGPLLRDELRALAGIGSAVCATGVVMALGVAVAGLWALPVFSVPLLLTQLSLRRHALVRTTYRQTITSLARATEIAGYTPHGHARRVAGLSRAVGRELGLSEPALTVLEYAALMHDIGQLSLVDPVPGGATAPLPPAEQRRIALLGGAVVRQTGVDAKVAVIVERQADPYREQPLTARIVRAVNAYEDLAGESEGVRGAGGPLGALERLRLGTGHDYQPEVVESLARVLSRGGVA